MSSISAQEIVEEITDSDAVLFYDQYKEPYISPYGSGRHIIKLTSKEFKHWLSAYCYNNFSITPSLVKIGSIVQALSGAALYEGEMKPLATRFVFKDGVYWYDLGKSAVRVDKDGWSIVEQPPILFRRYAHQMPQCEPVRGGSLEALKSFVNIERDEDIVLFTVFTVTAFIPDFPHPLLVLSGPQGAGKSTPMRLLKELIDPSVLKGVPSPRDLASFAQFANHHAFMFFDNLSSMPTWFSDALARASTGDGFSKRALYSDDDDIFYTIQRPIALNGISQVITKPDLLDRSILLGLKRLAPEIRLSEDEFWKEFNKVRPLLLGAVFDVISEALGTIDKVELEWRPRLVDFAQWGYATAEAIGIGGDTFVQAYQANIERQDEEAIEASPAGQALIIFMQDEKEWSGTASQLMFQLNGVGNKYDLTDSFYWPRDSSWLTKRLNELEPNLMARGIHIKRYISNMQRITDITYTPIESDEESNNTKTVETVNNQSEIPLDEIPF
jgi:hypothetical protein